MHAWPASRETDKDGQVHTFMCSYQSQRSERERVPPSAWPSSTSGAKQKDPADPLELSRSMTQAAHLCSAIEHLLIGELDTPRVAHSRFKWHTCSVHRVFPGEIQSVPVLVSINDLDGIATVRYMHLIHRLAKNWQGQGRFNMFAKQRCAARCLRRRLRL